MSEWISNDSLKDVLSFSATVSTVLQFLTGSLICREYFKLKSVGDVSFLSLVYEAIIIMKLPLQTSSLPFTIGCLSCSLWLRYGTLINEPTVIFVNAVGVLLFLSYCTSYFIFTVKKRKILQQLCLVLLMISFAVGYSYIEYSDVESSRLIGESCLLSIVYTYSDKVIKIFSCHFRCIVLLSQCIFLRESSDSAEACHTDTEQLQSSLSDNNFVIFRDSAVVDLRIYH